MMTEFSVDLSTAVLNSPRCIESTLVTVKVCDHRRQQLDLSCVVSGECRTAATIVCVLYQFTLD